MAGVAVETQGEPAVGAQLARGVPLITDNDVRGTSRRASAFRLAPLRLLTGLATMQRA